MDLSPELSVSSSNTERHARLLGAWLASYGSVNTQDAYSRDARVFLAYLETTGLDLLAVRPAHLNLFARIRQAAGDAPATLNRRLAAVSALYSRAVDDGALALNPAERVRRAAIDAGYTTTAALTRQEAEDLLAAAKSHSPRAHALVDLLLSTGIRISEALGARTSALSGNRLVITRQGGKTAVIPIPEHTMEALQAMTGATSREAAGSEEADPWLFATASGRPWTRVNAANLLRRVAIRAGVTKPVSPHVLRHTHATLALDMGVALHQLQESLGHTDPRSTRRYVPHNGPGSGLSP